MVGIVCAIVMIGTILVPNIEDFTQTEETVTNEGVYYIVNDDESHTLSYDGSTYSIDGTALTSPGNEYTLLATDTELFRTSYQGLQLRGELAATVTSCDITISDGTITGTYVVDDTETEISLTYEEYVLATSESESLIMKSYSSTAYILADSELMGRGLTKIYTASDYSSGNYLYLQLDGSISDGVSVTIADGYTVDNVEVNYSATEGFVDLYTFESITFEVTHTASETVTEVTYTAIIVPSEVTAETSDHLPDSLIYMLNIIPLFVILAVLCAVTYAVMRNRD